MDMSDEYYATSAPDRYSVLKYFSKDNKQASTDAEKILWEYLRAKRTGVKFRRQHPILDYIADFVCLSEKLIIEVDGEYHNVESQKQDDINRDKRLASMGYRVLRFTNEKVFNDIDFVLAKIKDNIKNI